MLMFAFRVAVGWENSHPPPLGEEREAPLQQHEESVDEADEKVNVHDRPNEPAEKSAEAQEAQIGDGVSPADDGEVALVPVPERRWRLRMERSGPAISSADSRPVAT
jgi:hypothetical protein